MNWHDFIFSDKRSKRLKRHLSFWLLWFIYFTASYYHYQQTGLEKAEFEFWNIPFVIKTTLLLILHILACYLFINFLMRRYLFTKKYITLALGVLVLSFLILVSSYFFHRTLFPAIDTAFTYSPAIANKNIWWTSIVAGLLSAPKVISAAVAIKLLKRWYLKQKEKERLDKEKLITDLQLLKAQMHPEFLFSSLHNICRLTERKEPDKASMLLLKLADMLSYMIYDSDHNRVPLEKEIKMIKDYLVLEKVRMGNRLELDIAVKGEIPGAMITPLLLFSFVENSVSYISNNKLETAWINLEFQIARGELIMKIIHGKTNEPLSEASYENAKPGIRKRLDFFYPGRYELKTTVEPEVIMINLKIMLQDVSDTVTNNTNKEEQFAYVTA